MRVCLAGAKSCPPIIGGIEVFVYEIGRRLASAGVDVTVIVPRRENERKQEEVDGISVRRVRSIPSRHLLKVSMMPGVLRVGSDEKPDVFHANDPPSGIVALAWSRWKSSVFTVHGAGVSPSEWPTPFRQGGRILQGLAAKGADVVTTTDGATAKLLGRYRDEVIVIPPGVDTQLLKKIGRSRPEVARDDRINILFVGRLTEVKGIDILFEGLSHISPEVAKRLALTVIGDGPLAAVVRNHASNRPEVNWIGQVPHAGIPAYFAKADLLVMPSRSEGLPITMLEAMSTGLPVVATTVGGIATHFDDRHLMRIGTLTPQGVAQAIEQAIENADEMTRRAKAARELVESEFSWDKVAEAYRQLYARIAK